MTGILLLCFFVASSSAQTEPTVRIGLNQNASTVTVRSANAFSVQQNRTRSARFTMILSVDPAAAKALTRADLQYRALVELDGGRLLVLPRTTKVRIEPAGAVLEIENRSYRGAIEVFGNSRNTFNILNELPVEHYLMGSAGRCSERVEPVDVRAARSSQGAGCRGPHVHPAESGPVQKRRLRHL
jgi:hypothetical protein